LTLIPDIFFYFIGAVAGPTECEVCKIVLKVVDTFLGENRTEVKKKIVLLICVFIFQKSKTNYSIVWVV
jgi:hypothetical protein